MTGLLIVVLFVVVPWLTARRLKSLLPQVAVPVDSDALPVGRPAFYGNVSSSPVAGVHNVADGIESTGTGVGANPHPVTELVGEVGSIQTPSVRRGSTT